MIKNIVDMLQVSDFYKESENIDFAKGKNQIPKTWKGLVNNIKRRLWQTKR